MLILLACAEAPPLECSASVDDAMPTVVHITWDAAEDATAHVEFNGQTTPSQKVNGAVDIPLYGVAEATAVTFRAVSETDAGEAYCEGEITTGTFDGAPSFSLSVDDAGQDPDVPYLVGALWSLDTTAGIFITNRAAELVWWLPYDGEHNPFEAMPTADGAGFVANSFNGDHSIDDGAIVAFSLAGETTATTQTPGGHHFFTTVGDEGLAWLAVDIRAWEDPESGQTVDVVGDQIVEWASDGTTRTIFSTWDVMEVEKGTDWNLGFYPQGKDWTHANSLKYHPETDHYLISFNSIRLVLEVDRATGAVVRSFGDTTQFDDAYAVSDGDAWEHQHDVELVGADEIQMFGSAGGRSGGLRYRIDEASHSLIQTQNVGFNLDMSIFVLGQNTTLGNGDSLLNYATLSALVEVDTAGEVVWQLDNGSGLFFGNVHPFVSFYP